MSLTEDLPETHTDSFCRRSSSFPSLWDPAHHLWQTFWTYIPFVFWHYHSCDCSNPIGGAEPGRGPDKHGHTGLSSCCQLLTGSASLKLGRGWRWGSRCAASDVTTQRRISQNPRHVTQSLYLGDWGHTVRAGRGGHTHKSQIRHSLCPAVSWKLILT